jgi:hypothetical protein
MIRVTEMKISVRAWSDSVSFKPLARQLGAHTIIVYDKGELIRGRRRAPNNYLSTEDITIAGMANLNRTIREQIAFIMRNATLSSLTRAGDGKVYVWVAVFGDIPCETASLGIDMRQFGHGIGLIVDNFTTFDEGGNPKLLDIKPFAA